MELKRFLNNLFDRENEASLSRRDALAGLGLVGVLLAAPKLIAATPAEAKALEKPPEAALGSSQDETKRDETQVAEADGAELNAAEASDATDLSARRYWRRRWRRRYWRRRYWRPRFWRRRRWWRRRWRRRYWY